MKSSKKFNRSKMIIDTLRLLFKRDLLKLRIEIELYKRESNLWKTEKHIANSAGNLCLHLVGNLNAHIGNVLGKTDYLRNRNDEFSLKNLPKTVLLAKIDETIEVVDVSLSNLPESICKKEYPLLFSGEKVSTEYMLLHLATHLNYHLGQINYHRRLIDS